MDRLEAEILLSLGTKDPDRQLSIWMDRRLRGNQPLTDTLKEEVEASALLVVVMSDFFLQSSWCEDEVGWFRQSGVDRGQSRENIFVVRAMPTDEARWPAGLRDSSDRVLVGYRFHSPGSEIDDVPMPFGWPVPSDHDQDYSQSVTKLAAHISRQLKRLGASDPSKLAGARPEVPVAGRSVFLGCMHDTLDEERADLRHRLAASGMVVLPPEAEDPVDEPSLLASIDKYLRGSDAMVLIANEYRGAWPKDQPAGFISLQIQKAKDFEGSL